MINSPDPRWYVSPESLAIIPVRYFDGHDTAVNTLDDSLVYLDKGEEKYIFFTQKEAEDCRALLLDFEKRLRSHISYKVSRERL